MLVSKTHGPYHIAVENNHNCFSLDDDDDDDDDEDDDDDDEGGIIISFGSANSSIDQHQPMTSEASKALSRPKTNTVWFHKAKN